MVHVVDPSSCAPSTTGTETARELHHPKQGSHSASRVAEGLRAIGPGHVRLGGKAGLHCQFIGTHVFLGEAA